MAGELSGILEHVDRISGLDLDGVELTAHVVALENVLRADDPEPSLPRDRALELTAAEAGRRIETGELSADEYFDAWAQAAAGDELNAFLWRADPEQPPVIASAGPAADAQLRGVPVAVKDLFCTEDIETTAGSRILEG